MGHWNLQPVCQAGSQLVLGTSYTHRMWAHHPMVVPQVGAFSRHMQGRKPLNQLPLFLLPPAGTGAPSTLLWTVTRLFILCFFF